LILIKFDELKHLSNQKKRN